MNVVLKTVVVQPQIMKMKVPGKNSKQRAKLRTILDTLSTEHEARMDLAKSYENRDKLVDKNLSSQVQINQR